MKGRLEKENLIHHRIYDAGVMRDRFEAIMRKHLRPFTEAAGFRWAGRRARRRDGDFVHLIEVNLGRWQTGINYSFSIDISLWWTPAAESGTCPSLESLRRSQGLLLGKSLAPRHWPEAEQVIWDDWQQRSGLSDAALREISAQARRARVDVQAEGGGRTGYFISAYQPVASLAAGLLEDVKEQAWPFFAAYLDLDAVVAAAAKQGPNLGLLKALAGTGRSEEARRLLATMDLPAEVRERTREWLGL